MDLMMPVLDGLTAIQTLKIMNPEVKIIANSGLSAQSQQALSAGAQEFLLKPYTTQDLLNTLAKVITKNPVGD
jgi:hypothetical protein